MRKSVFSIPKPLFKVELRLVIYWDGFETYLQVYSQLDLLVWSWQNSEAVKFHKNVKVSS